MLSSEPTMNSQIINQNVYSPSQKVMEFFSFEIVDIISFCRSLLVELERDIKLSLIITWPKLTLSHVDFSSSLCTLWAPLREGSLPATRVSQEEGSLVGSSISGGQGTGWRQKGLNSAHPGPYCFVNEAPRQGGGRPVLSHLVSFLEVVIEAELQDLFVLPKEFGRGEGMWTRKSGRPGFRSQGAASRPVDL